MADFPNVGIQNMTLRLKSAVAMSQSPFTFDQQTYQHQGVRWECEVTLSPMTRAEAKQVEGFLFGLRGMANTFKLGHPLHNTTATGTITGSANSDTVTASISGASVGDYFEYADHLYIITSISGSTYGIMPPLRSSASSATVDFTYPKGTWRLATNDIQFNSDVAGIYTFTLPLVEGL